MTRPIVFLHPGMGKGERHYLESVGTVSDLLKHGITLKEGSTLTFYDYDASAKRDDDKLLFEGTIGYDSEKQEWFTMIDWSSFRHESDETSSEDANKRGSERGEPG